MTDRASLSGATCVVLVDGRAKGSGFLIDDGRVVTAAHVVASAGDDLGITVDFPVGQITSAANDSDIPVTRTDLDGAAALEVAVLELTAHPPEGVEPLAVWPGRRLPGALELFGFPRGDRTGRGSWVPLEQARPIGDRQVQVDWAKGVGSLGGHSGGPVVDVDTWSVVGVLVEGSEQGQFDRVVPMRALADPQVWPGWRLPWLYSGQEAQRHFRLRARGQRSTDRGGDLFQGRTAALAAIQARAGSGRPVIVAGNPGSGKSAVVARLGISLADDPASDEGVLFHAHEASAEQLVDAVAAKVGLAGVSSGPDLADRLVETGMVLWVIVDALDEARTNTDRRELARTLAELATVPDVRVVVATRRSTHEPYGPTSPVRLLGARSDDHVALIDLDHDDYFEPAALGDYTQAVLCQTGASRPTPPAGGAWEVYRTDGLLAQRLAATIADRAGRTYLVAAMAADELGRRDHHDVVDPDRDDFDPDSIPTGIGQALDKYLERVDRDDPDSGRQLEGLLTALAYARGGGFDDHTWKTVTTRLTGIDVGRGELDRLRGSPAADYLLETSTQETGSRVTRLFHQALIDELQARRHDRHRDEADITDLLADTARQVGWVAAADDTRRHSVYTRRHLAEHAHDADRLRELLNEPGFLAAAVPGSLRRLLPSPTSPADPAAIYSLAAHLLGDNVAGNAAVLQTVSLIQRNRHLSDQLVELGSRLDSENEQVGYQTTATGTRPHRPLLARVDGHEGPVVAVAIADWPGLDHQVVVTASDDGTARVWDPGQPDVELARFDGHHDSPVAAVAVLDWPDLDHQVVVTGSVDGTARVWDPRQPDIELARFDGHHDFKVAAVAMLDWPGLDHPVVVTGSHDGTARVWDPRQPDMELACFDGHHASPVAAVAVTDWPGLDGQVVVTGSWDGTARLWNPHQLDGELARFDRHRRQPVVAVAVLDWPGLDGQVVVTGSHDGTARAWDPRQPDMELARFDGHHDNGVVAVAVTDWPGLDGQVVVTGSHDGTARVWDPRQPDVELAGIDGHDSWVEAVAALDWPGLDHPVIVTASWDGTARVWDPQQPDIELGRIDGHHDNGVVAVAMADWPGLDGQVVVTGSVDGTARVWDPRQPDMELARFDGHDDPVLALAMLDWPGLDHPVIVTASWDGTARVWDPQQPDIELARFDGHQSPVVAVAVLDWPSLDHQVVVTGSVDRTARVWDPRQPDVELARFVGHDNDVVAVAVTDWPGLDHQIVVTTSHDGTARVWDHRRPDVELVRLDGHDDPVLALAMLDWPGLDHPVIVTGSVDGTARVWDPRQPDMELARFDGHHDGPVVAVAVLDWPGLDHQVVVTASNDGTARIWDPLVGEGGVLVRLTALHPCHAVAACAVDPMVYVGTTRGWLEFHIDIASKDWSTPVVGP